MNEEDYHGRPDGRRPVPSCRPGGSRDAYELLQEDGIDLATDTPYDALLARMDRIIDEIEGILDRQ